MRAAAVADARYEGVSLKGLKAKKRQNVVLFSPDASKRAEEAKIRRNQDLVVQYRVKARKLGRSILRKWHARLDMQEIDSVVDLSLCEAVRRYNPRKGASFMTFLYYHLRGNLIRCVSYAATANVVPMADEEFFRTSEGEGGRRTYRGINAMEVAEALCSSDHELPDEVLLKKELVAMSVEACSQLDSLEREVIERLYLEGQQLMDIARQLGYSRCHISRVKRKALESLYEEMSAKLGDEDGLLRRAFEPEGEEKRRGAAPRRIAKRKSIAARRTTRIAQAA